MEGWHPALGLAHLLCGECGQRPTLQEVRASGQPSPGRTAVREEPGLSQLRVDGITGEKGSVLPVEGERARAGSQNKEGHTFRKNSKRRLCLMGWL